MKKDIRREQSRYELLMIERNELLAACEIAQTHWFISDDYARDSKDWKQVEAAIDKAKGSK